MSVKKVRVLRNERGKLMFSSEFRERAKSLLFLKTRLKTKKLSSWN